MDPKSMATFLIGLEHKSCNLIGWKTVPQTLSSLVRDNAISQMMWDKEMTFLLFDICAMPETVFPPPNSPWTQVTKWLWRTSRAQWVSPSSTPCSWGRARWSSASSRPTSGWWCSRPRPLLRRLSRTWMGPRMGTWLCLSGTQLRYETLASDWSILVTWPQYWPLIGQCTVK